MISNSICHLGNCILHPAVFEVPTFKFHPSFCYLRIEFSSIRNTAISCTCMMLLAVLQISCADPSLSVRRMLRVEFGTTRYGSCRIRRTQSDSAQFGELVHWVVARGRRPVRAYGRTRGCRRCHSRTSSLAFQQSQWGTGSHDAMHGPLSPTWDEPGYVEGFLYRFLIRPNLRYFCF